MRNALLSLFATSFILSQGEAAEMIQVKPKTHERHLRNPGMGLVLYLWGDAMPTSLPDRADVLYVTLLWSEIEKGQGEYNFLVPKLKNALLLAEKFDRKVAIRLASSYQNAPCPIPEYLLKRGVKLFPWPVPANDPLLSKWNKDFFEPEWWHPEYIKANRKMVEAYGKALDGHPRIAYIDMRFYGYWGEGHRCGAKVPWPESVDKRTWCKERIDEYTAAFKKTPLAVETSSDEKTPFPAGTAIDYAVDKGAWMRRDGFGNYVSDEESVFLKAQWKRSLMIAEAAQALDAHLDGKVRKWWVKDAKPVTIDELFDEMFEHHVNYLPFGWTLEHYQLLEQKRPDLWKKASLRTGYRMIVTEASWPKTPRASEPLHIKTTWRNTGVGRLPFPYVPTAYLLDPSGKPVARAQRPEAIVTEWYEDEDHLVEFTFPLNKALRSGEYKIAVAIEDMASQPAVQLGIEGADSHKRHVLGSIELN